MKRFFILVTFFFSVNLYASEEWSNIPSISGNGTIPVFSISRDDSTATVVLIPGGPFTIGNKSPDTGRPDGINFVVRSAGQFSQEKLNVVLMGKPDKAGDLRSTEQRQKDHHASDVMEVVGFAKKFDKPIWLVGTSLGAISVVNAVLTDKNVLVKGVVLSSSSFKDKRGYGVLSMDLEKLLVPVLLSGHEKDECPATNPKFNEDARKRLTASKKVAISLISTGSAPTGNICGPKHWHGYINAEVDAVRSISEFIRSN